MSFDPQTEQVLCQLEDIQEGKSKGFFPVKREDRVLAVRKGNQVYVYMNSCPHEWVPMDLRKDYFLSGNGADIMCYAHNAHFEIETGLCTTGPCLNKQLVKVPSRVESGQVIVPLELPYVALNRPGM